jgi:glucose-6-phosphate 1-epimerase
MTDDTLRELMERPLPAFARIVSGPGGPLLVVQTEQCRAETSVYGAQVLAWDPSSSSSSSPSPSSFSSPVLFCSPRTAWGGGKAIRGGIPVCFPWFGAQRRPASAALAATGGSPPSPSHGFARTRPWYLERIAEEQGRIIAVFLLVSDDDTLAWWPFAFEARLTAVFGAALSVSLEVTNVDDQPFSYEAALHTYLGVSDVEQVEVHGLAGTRFIDKTDGEAVGSHGRDPLMIAGEVDRVFFGTKQPVVVHDRALGRTLRVEKTGSSATVVWNPGLVKASALADVGGALWRQFVCVETAQVYPTPVTLPPGARHTMSMRLTARS